MPDETSFEAVFPIQYPETLAETQEMVDSMISALNYTFDRFAHTESVLGSQTYLTGGAQDALSTSREYRERILNQLRAFVDGISS